MPTLSPRKLLFAATLASTASGGAALANPAATPLTTAGGRPACGNTNSKRQCARATEPATLSAEAAAPLRTPADRPATGNVGQRGQTDAPAVALGPVGPLGPVGFAIAAAPVATSALAASASTAVGRRSPFFAGLRSLLRVTISPAVALTPLLTGAARPACANLVGKGDMTATESTVLPCLQAAP